MEINEIIALGKKVEIRPEFVRPARATYLVPLQHLFDELTNHEIRMWNFDKEKERDSFFYKLKNAAKRGKYNILIIKRNIVDFNKTIYYVDIEKAGIKKDF